MIEYWHEPTPSDNLKKLLEKNNFSLRKGNYTKYENYYDGIQSTKLTARQKDYLEQSTGNDYSENICDIIVNKMSDKIEVQSFVATPENENSTKISEQIIENSSIRSVLKTAITKTIELGDGYLIVDWNEENKQAEIIFNHPKMVNVIYDNENPNEIIFALKTWLSYEKGFLNPNGDEIQRLNLYANDRVEKYYCVGEGGDWEPWITEEGEWWPMPWTVDSKPGSKPLGVPVFHLKNNDRGKQFGTSELKKAIPLQNSLNKLWLDLFTIADAQAYPTRWVIGDSSTGTIKTNPGTLIKFANNDAKTGQWDAADLKQVIDLVQFRYRTIAAQTSTPFNELVRATTGTQSGESIRQAEQPLVEKVKDRQPFLGVSIGAAMKMAVKIQMIFGAETQIPETDLENIRFDVIWTPAQDRDEAKELESAEAKKRLGIPLDIILSELGYENVEEIMQKIDENEQKRFDENNRQINAGLLPTV